MIQGPLQAISISTTWTSSNIRLGSNNDTFELNHSLANTQVSIDGGSGDDRFNLTKLGNAPNQVVGGEGLRWLDIVINGFPQRQQIPNARFSIESLILDNSANTSPVAWIHRSGMIQAQPIPKSGAPVEVISTDGVELTRIIGGTASDTLEVISETDNDVPGRD